MSATATKPRSATALTRYVRKVQALMALGEWTIEAEFVDREDAVSPYPPGKYGASCTTYFHHSGPVEVKVNVDLWRESDLYFRRWLIVHELAHLFLTPFKQLSHDSERVAEEVMVERLTNVIAPHAPLPGPRV